MKLLLALLLAITLCACSKDQDEELIDKPSSMSATFNGMRYEAIDPKVVKHWDGEIILRGHFKIIDDEEVLDEYLVMHVFPDDFKGVSSYENARASYWVTTKEAIYQHFWDYTVSESVLTFTQYDMSESHKSEDKTRASGTFSCILAHYQDHEKLLKIEGTFTNLEINF